MCWNIKQILSRNPVFFSGAGVRISAAVTRFRRTALKDNIDNLVRQAQQGDRSEFDKLYEKYQERIVAYCGRLLGNREEGEEVTQEVFFKAWKYLPYFRFESPFDHWLIRIATNACRNHIRAEKERKELYEVSIDTEAGQAIVKPGTTTEEEVVSREYCQQLLQCIRETAKAAKPPWDALDWSIFHLHYAENVAQKREVAYKLGKSEDTIKYRIYNRIHPVLERVRERLQAEEA